MFEYFGHNCTKEYLRQLNKEKNLFISKHMYNGLFQFIEVGNYPKDTYLLGLTENKEPHITYFDSITNEWIIRNPRKYDSFGLLVTEYEHEYDVNMHMYKIIYLPNPK